MFYLIMQESLCTHLRVFAVAIIQALEWEVAGLLVEFARAGAAKCAELAEFLGFGVVTRAKLAEFAGQNLLIRW